MKRRRRGADEKPDVAFPSAVDAGAEGQRTDEKEGPNADGEQNLRRAAMARHARKYAVFYEPRGGNLECLPAEDLMWKLVLQMSRGNVRKIVPRTSSVPVHFMLGSSKMHNSSVRIPGRPCERATWQ